MESQNFVVNGGIKMPIGFRFHPTDEELVVHYLKRKVLCLPLPASVIPEFDVFQTDPWSLPGDMKENRYFFSNRYGNDINNKCKRVVAGSGYWKPIGKEKPILASGTNQVVGMRKALIFCERKRSNETKTRWLLHQYRLVGSVATLDSTQMFKRELFGDWLVFRVFQRKQKAKDGVISNKCPITNAMTMPSCIDFTVEDCSVFGPPQPTSPSSSEITEVCFNGLDQEESSGFISSYSHCCMRKQ
ncbi:hypothetical protein REPUB_Repub10bG0006000 [Reevesia pubescens]